MSRIFCFVLAILCIVAAVGCDEGTRTGNVPLGGSSQGPAPSVKDIVQVDTRDESGGAVLTFELELDKHTYQDSNWGEPPQIAIWLEEVGTDNIRTVCVTRRTGKGKWLGKAKCLVSLPYWVSRYNKESGTTGPPSPRQPVVDAITAATPKQGLVAMTTVPAGSKWNYFIEINVSGDFNNIFPWMIADGAPDPDGNGQPSLIYRGQIKAVAGEKDVPKPIGRTKQWDPVDYIIPDLNGMTKAQELLSKIEVSCQ